MWTLLEFVVVKDFSFLNDLGRNLIYVHRKRFAAMCAADITVTLARVIRGTVMMERDICCKPVCGRHGARLIIAEPFQSWQQCSHFTPKDAEVEFQCPTSSR